MRWLGYAVTRQKGSHVRLTGQAARGQHHLTIPLHNPLKIGTLSGILDDLAAAHQTTRDDMLRRLF